MKLKRRWMRVHIRMKPQINLSVNFHLKRNDKLNPELLLMSLKNRKWNLSSLLSLFKTISLQFKTWFQVSTQSMESENFSFQKHTAFASQIWGLLMDMDNLQILNFPLIHTQKFQIYLTWILSLWVVDWHLPCF